ncbi:hypothetical protein Bca4012_071686 [Brassica carinata]|uniref:F-box associated beta-propeller type 3 domain-containing protein n=1 Tax=Brassica oleracea var. oleracea TaxID=109376 RepID=A0A0D3CD91_BRAOL
MWTDKNEVPVICNPNTGRYETLPYISRYRRSYSLFGFDPVEKQYKVTRLSVRKRLGRKSSFAIACFDIRSEKFKILYPESFCELTNYNGKLGVIYYDDLTHDAVELRVWVLEDVDKQEWSKYSYTLRGDKLFPHYASVVGVISTGFGEYLEASKCRVYVFADDCSRFYSFAHHVQDLNVKDPELLKSSIDSPYLKNEESEEE